MTGVVANLVYKRCDDFRQPVILLQVNGQIRIGLSTDFSESCGILRAVDGHANDVCPRLEQSFDLTDRCVDILRMRRSHALNRDRVPGTNCRCSNFYRTSRISPKFHYCLRVVAITAPGPSGL